MNTMFSRLTIVHIVLILKKMRTVGFCFLLQFIFVTTSLLLLITYVMWFGPNKIDIAQPSQQRSEIAKITINMTVFF